MADTNRTLDWLREEFQAALQFGEQKGGQQTNSSPPGFWYMARSPSGRATLRRWIKTLGPSDNEDEQDTIKLLGRTVAPLSRSTNCTHWTSYSVRSGAISAEIRSPRLSGCKATHTGHVSITLLNRELMSFQTPALDSAGAAALAVDEMVYELGDDLKRTCECFYQCHHSRWCIVPQRNRSTPRRIRWDQW